MSNDSIAPQVSVVIPCFNAGRWLDLFARLGPPR
jgi:hypothetical protein